MPGSVHICPVELARLRQENDELKARNKALLKDHRHEINALRLENTALSAAANSSDDIFVFSLDREYKYIVFNELHRLALLSDFNAEIQKGDCIFDFINDKPYIASLKKNIDRALSGERFISIIHHPRNESIYEVSWNPVKQGEIVIGAAALARNISDIKAFEEKYTESETRFRKIFEDGPFGMALIGPDLKFLLANPNFCAMTGYSQNELKNIAFPEISFDEELVRDLPEARKVMKGETKVQKTVKRYKRKDGDTIWVSLTATGIFDKKGNHLYNLAIFEDITEQKLKEEKANAASERLKLAARVSNIGAWEWHIQQDELIWDEQMYKLFGINQGTTGLKYESWMEMVHPDDREMSGKVVSDTLANKGEYDNEFRVVWPDGSVHWLKASGKVITGSNGEVTGTIGVNYDITERKLMEAAILENKLLLDAALESITDAIFISDIEGNFLHFNEAFATYHKFRNKEECAKTLIEYPEFLNVYFPDGSLAPLKDWAVPRALRGEVETNAEYWLERTDTGERWIGSYSFAPIRDAEGKITGSVVVGRDVTAQKRTEQALYASEERYRQLVNNYPNSTVTVIDRDYRLKFAAGAISAEMANAYPGILDRSFRELVSETTFSQAEPYIVSAFRGDAGSFETVHHDRHFYITVTPLHDLKGKIDEILVIFQDETERKNAQIALKEREMLFSAIFNASPNTIALTDIEGNRFVEVNRSFEAFTGIPQEEVIGRNWMELGLWKYPEEYEMFRSIFKRDGRVSNFELSAVARGGAEGILLLSAEVVNLNGKPYMLSMGTDITGLKKAEESLLRSQILLREVSTIARIGGWEYNPATNVGIWSEEVYNIYELDQDAPSGVELGLKYYTDESREIVLEAFTRAVKEAIGYDLELEIISAKGKRKWIRTIGHPVTENGKVVRVYGSFQDISERRKIEDALRESEARFRNLVWDLQVGVILQDASAKIILSNPKALELLGLTEDQVLGRTSYDPEWNMIHEDGSPFPERDHPVSIAIATAKPVNNVVMGVYRPASRDKVWILADALPQLNDDGSVRQVVCSFIDITKRKRAEQELRMQTERLQVMHEIDNAILQSLESPQAIVTDTLVKLKKLLNCHNTAIGYFDPVTMKMDYYSPLGLVEEPLSLVFSLDREGYGDMTEMTDGKFESVDDISTVTLPDGLVKALETNHIKSFINIPMFSAQAFYGTLNIGWNEPHRITRSEIEIVTEVASHFSLAIEQAFMHSENLRYTRELEERVLERTRQLTETNLELEAFSYSVSHDLRAPLRHINGFIELLIEKYSAELPGKAHYYLDAITSSSKQMGTLIDDLLRFSRTSRQEMTKTIVNMNLLVSEVIKSLDQDTAGRNIQFVVEKLPEVTGDLSLLRQVWQNLVSNAVKFTRKQETPVIKISSYEENLENIFTISDNGAGFDMKYAHKLFGVFQRLHSAAEFEGTGIGLANVKRIVSKHGGRIWAESEPGKGAAFHFSIPIN